MRKLFTIISFLLWTIPAHAQCNLLWQTPVAHFPSDPAPRPPATLSGPTSWSASMSCPAGVKPTQVYIYYGDPDGTPNLTYNGESSASICSTATISCWPPPPFTAWSNPNNYRGPFFVPGAVISANGVSFTLDPTTLMPGTTANPVPYDVNIGVADSAGNDLGSTPKACAPTGDCDIQIYVAAGEQTPPPSQPQPMPSATPTAPSAPSGGAPSITIMSPLNNGTVSGTITVSAMVSNGGNDYTKWYLPNPPQNGTCAFGTFDNAWNGCSLYEATSFTYDTSLLPNGASGFFVQLVNQSGRADFSASTSITVTQ